MHQRDRHSCCTNDDPPSIGFPKSVNGGRICKRGVRLIDIYPPQFELYNLPEVIELELISSLHRARHCDEVL
ncbi:MAG: hypothetical protein ACI87E_002735 [Mariniblastus sp.]|jgi:hypothetical protein